MKDINMILGERICSMRKKLGITREKLAENVDISSRFLADVEGGKVGVSLQTLKNLSSSLSVSTDYLLGINDELSNNELSDLIGQLSVLNKEFYPIVSATISELTKLK
ncbi:MAG: helix-turn-helix domain-containing protein [Clostridiales bacterium]|nr:helix-turn-helix domain-containing protein [Clostridiales bacterium]